MYYQAISQCTQMLKNLESWLDKADEYANAKTFDVCVLMNGRLAPDMKAFIYQVQSACDYVKAAAAWLSGQTPPKHEDNEQTIDEVRAHLEDRRIRGEREGSAVRRRRREEGQPLLGARQGAGGGEDYLLQMTIPNVYFHIAM